MAKTRKLKAVEVFELAALRNADTFVQYDCALEKNIAQKPIDGYEEAKAIVLAKKGRLLVYAYNHAQESRGACSRHTLLTPELIEIHETFPVS